MTKRRLKLELAVTSNAGKKTNILEVQTIFHDGQLGGIKRYCYRVSSVEKGTSESGMPYTAFDLTGLSWQTTCDDTARFNATRLAKLHAEALRQVTARAGVVWEMVEDLLRREDLTLISNVPV